MLFFTLSGSFHTFSDRLVGLVVRRPPREQKILDSNPACAGIFSLRGREGGGGGGECVESYQ